MHRVETVAGCMKRMGGYRCLRKISATSEEGWSKREHDTTAFIIIIIIILHNSDPESTPRSCIKSVRVVQTSWKSVNAESKLHQWVKEWEQIQSELNATLGDVTAQQNAAGRGTTSGHTERWPRKTETRTTRTPTTKQSRVNSKMTRRRKVQKSLKLKTRRSRAADLDQTRW